ncbi:hypothetical protein GOBAR_DD05473 [Gossypium barbadense]|nr:hypothetical protein GOBAR_DD05473 [Gossypium barbadense]
MKSDAESRYMRFQGLRVLRINLAGFMFEIYWCTKKSPNKVDIPYYVFVCHIKQDSLVFYGYGNLRLLSKAPLSARWLLEIAYMSSRQNSLKMKPALVKERVLPLPLLKYDGSGGEQSVNPSV